MKKIFKYLLVIFSVLVSLILTWLGFIKYGGNFHKITSNIYRSAQLYNYNFPKFYNKYHFKTILNLRGAHSDKAWYVYERNFCKEHKIRLIDFGISDKEIQSIQKMKQIIKIIKNSKKPILIHCKAGADRTGLATALYLYSIKDKNYSEMLSLKYGHFPYLGSPTKAIDISLKKFIKAQSQP